MQLVEEQDDVALRLGDLGQHGLQPVLELAPVLGAGDERADVERDHAPAPQRLGYVAGDDSPRQPLDDCGLADAWIADQHGIVLGPAREHLNDAANLLVAADDGVELVFLRESRQVLAEALERLVLLLGALVGDAVGPANLGDRLQQAVVGHAGSCERLACAALVVTEREQQMLG